MYDKASPFIAPNIHSYEFSDEMFGAVKLGNVEGGFLESRQCEVGGVCRFEGNVSLLLYSLKICVIIKAKLFLREP